MLKTLPDSERDEIVEICRDKDGNTEPDPELRDTKNVPLKEDINAYFKREVMPHVPDAWINTSICDHRDGTVGKVGYEINFNRYFYKYQPPRPLEMIEADIRTLEKQARNLGMFVEDRELLTCPRCGLEEDVSFQGLLIVSYPSNAGVDTGLRFQDANSGTNRFCCPHHAAVSSTHLCVRN